MTAYRIHWLGIIAALLLAPTFTMGAKGQDDLPLGAEIHRRFGNDADEMDDEFVPLEQTALRFTQSMGWGFAGVGAVVINESSGNSSRPRREFSLRGVRARDLGLRPWRAQLENDVEPPHREPTLVEGWIAEGFPAGLRESVVEDVPPSNHFVVYSNEFAFGGVRFLR